MRSRTRELRAATVARMNSEIKLSRIPERSTDDEHSVGQIKRDRIFYCHGNFRIDQSLISSRIESPANAETHDTRRALTIFVSAIVHLRFRISARLQRSRDNISRVLGCYSAFRIFFVRITLDTFFCIICIRCIIIAYAVVLNYFRYDGMVGN